MRDSTWANIAVPFPWLLLEDGADHGDGVLESVDGICVDFVVICRVVLPNVLRFGVRKCWNTLCSSQWAATFSGSWHQTLPKSTRSRWSVFHVRVCPAAAEQSFAMRWITQQSFLCHLLRMVFDAAGSLSRLSQAWTDLQQSAASIVHLRSAGAHR